MAADTLEVMLAKHQIREALQGFCRGMDRFDRAAYMAAFHDDAEIAAGPFVGTAAECWDWAVPMHEAWQELTQHLLLQTNVDLDGEAAHAESYYQFVAVNRDGSLMLAGGRYLDRFEKRNGEWRIALRTNVIEWNCLPPALPMPFGDMPDVALNGVATRGPEDPSYRRPHVNHRARQIPGA